MPRGKQSGIRWALRYKNNHQSDIHLLIRLGKYIRNKWGLKFRREWYVGFNKVDGRVERIRREVTHREAEEYWWRNPDLLCIHERKGLIIIEIDGAIHDRKLAKTEQRNEQYKKANVSLIIINLRDIKTRGITIEEDLDWKIMKLLHGCPIGTG